MSIGEVSVVHECALGGESDRSVLHVQWDCLCKHCERVRGIATVTAIGNCKFLCDRRDLNIQ